MRIEKLDHVDHLEDIQFLGRRKEMLEIFKKFQENSSDLVVSEKIDGSPSIVFGKCPWTERTFISTKSFFNKKPIVCYSINDIENSFSNMDLKNKLYSVWNEIKNHKFTTFYQADYLFDTRSLSINEMKAYFKPNVLKYELENYHVVRAYKKIANGENIVGINVHTKYLRIQDSYSPFPHGNHFNMNVIRDSFQIDNVLDIGSIEYDLGEFEFNLKNLNLLEDLPEYSNPLIIKNINFCIKNNIEISDNHNIDPKDCVAFNIATHAKNDIMNQLNNYDMHSRCYINDFQCNPEGYVIYSLDRMKYYKLVNRRTFSYLNFALND